jgi:hypothetical protein
MSESIIRKKSFELAIRGVNFYKYLTSEKKEFVISKQFLRSVTSIGTNVKKFSMLKAKPILFTNYLFHKKNVMKRCIG